MEGYLIKPLHPSIAHCGYRQKAIRISPVSLFRFPKGRSNCQWRFRLAYRKGNIALGGRAIALPARFGMTTAIGMTALF